MSSESRSTDAPPGGRPPLLREYTGLDPAQQAERLAFFDVGPADIAALRAFGRLTAGAMDGIIEDFYAHLLRFPELVGLLQGEPGRLERLKATLRGYFASLTEGRFDEAYFESRLRVGDAHQRVGLRPSWYLGAFSLYLRLALRTLVTETGDGARILPALDALIKAVFLDTSLAMSTYIFGGYVQREVASELERAAQVAEEALRRHGEVERLKDDLTRMVVHDLKNPVSGIAMLAQLALRKGGDLPDAQQGYLRQIGRTCREMMRLIQNLLDISRLEEGKMPVVREAVLVGPLVDEVASDYAAVAEEGQRTVSAHIDPTIAPVVADRWLLRRVLGNLVINAIRHSGSEDVRIDAVAGPGPEEITVRVMDHGRGIPPEDHLVVFEKFRSVRRSATDAPGADTGLGLPFCRLAVERMGGRVGLASRPGHTVFSVTLPAARPGAT
jgi:signal transduction histidine kinase